MLQLSRENTRPGLTFCHALRSYVLCKAKSKAVLVSVAQRQRQALLILMFVVAPQQQHDKVALVVSIAVFSVQCSMRARVVLNSDRRYHVYVDHTISQSSASSAIYVYVCRRRSMELQVCRVDKRPGLVKV